MPERRDAALRACAPLNSDSFRLLYVCTGNICRSAFAEIFTQRLLVDRLGPAAAAFRVSSAGVRAVVDGRLHPGMYVELRRRDPAGSSGDVFRGRRLGSAMVEESDLVLGVEPLHRSAAVSCVPDALARAFALREFADLAAAVDPETLPAAPVPRAHALVEQAQRLRGRMPRKTGDAYAVPDPIDGPPEAYRHAAALIEQAVTGIVELLEPRPQTARTATTSSRGTAPASCE